MYRWCKWSKELGLGMGPGEENERYCVGKRREMVDVMGLAVLDERVNGPKGRRVWRQNGGIN